MTQPVPSLLLLIPAYNEENRIEPVLAEFAEYFQQHYPGKFQLVVVLNGCRDNTIGVVRRVADKYSTVSFLEFAEPIGKGGALIEGLKLAPLADLIGYVDVQSLLWLNIKDTQCPAKVIRRRAVEKIHASLLTADLAFDVNLLYSLKREGFSILEVPTEWTDKVGSKVTQTLVRSSLVMFLSVLRLRLIYSPFYPWLRKLLGPLEGWLYKKLRAPRPRSGSLPENKNHKDDKNGKDKKDKNNDRA